MRAGAGPAPIERVGCEPGGDRVACEVPVHGEQFAVVADSAGEAVGAEEVCPASMRAVVVARVSTVQPLQCFRQSRVGDLDERVVVVSHEDVGEQFDATRPEGRAEPLDEVDPVAVAEERWRLSLPCEATW